ncbi:hypothetical protein [Hyunsoonleella aestuarii]|uniref:DUF4230 domain-containing protein n=1 Tax=Hyunsoonleella aestuarii TaxID=912802 RepID=A0ABP8EEF6_9FLAO|nr:hypothetical protein [Hyunsoonleella aestuarii]
MKKWCFGAFIILLTLLFTINKGRTVLPNQEIVFEFSQAELTSDDIKTTIAIVKEQLLEVGVQNVVVNEDSDGKIKISYYSDTEVLTIKGLLSKRIKAELNVASSDGEEEESSSFPFEKEEVAYNLDVYEIQKSTDVDSDLNGIAVSKFTSKADRFSKPKIFTTPAKTDSEKENLKASLKLKIYTSIATAIKSTLQYIPEVRAGPAC